MAPSSVVSWQLLSRAIARPRTWTDTVPLAVTPPGSLLRSFSGLQVPAVAPRTVPVPRRAAAGGRPQVHVSTPHSPLRFLWQSGSRYCSALAHAAAMANKSDRDTLSKDTTPIHYDLRITDLDFKNWTYQGTVDIQLKTVKATKAIVLNALELKITTATASLSQSAGPIESTSIEYDEHAQRVTLTFAKELPAAPESTVHIAFEGSINNKMAGFYRSRYKPVEPAASSVPRDDDWHYMFSTQFEACDARRAFPCFDEPNLKATFDFAISVPDGLVAIGNMPVQETKKQSDDTSMVFFQRTPIMSTYLLAWAIGDFEYIEKSTDRQYNGRNIPVRVYATRGLAHQGTFALEHASAIIDYFSKVFDLDYSLPKADLLAVHEFNSGAMENWGLVTYRTTYVLFDEKTSDAEYRKRVAYVVAHELAHQWFGNLVTMDWWDELWLNESFATWVGWYAVDHLHPDWKVWTQFVGTDMQSGFKIDGLRSSHPIQVPVRDALEVDQIFDRISYEKGSCVIRMLAGHLGAETFLRGVSNYLKKHAHGNATTTDLWAALAEASGSDVSSFMHTWVSKIGHPVLTVAEPEPGTIALQQNRFLSSGDVRPEEDETVWWIPLSLRGKKGHDGVLALPMKSREERLTDVDPDFYTLNTDFPGFYHVKYPLARLQRLGTQLDRLSDSDKIAIISSTFTLCYAGQSTTSALLSFLQGFQEETNYVVVTQVLIVMQHIQNIFALSSDIEAGLQRFVLRLINTSVSSIGWDFPVGEDLLKTLLRKQLLLAAALNGHPEVEEEGIRLFRAWVRNPDAHPIPANLRAIVYMTAARKIPSEAVPALKQEWHTTVSVDGKATCLKALGYTTDLKTIQDQILPFLFNVSPPALPAESVLPADMIHLGISLDRNLHARRAQWDGLKARWDDVVAKLGGASALERFINQILVEFVTLDEARDVETFFAARDCRHFSRAVAVILDSIRARAAYRAREREGENIRQWLAENGYMA